MDGGYWIPLTLALSHPGEGTGTSRPSMPDLVGLIPAAGRGVRAYPHTATIPKSMLEVDGVPNLQRNVELMRDQLGIRDIRIVVGYQGDVIRRHFGDGSRFGVAVTYVDNRRLDLEMPYSVYLAGKTIAAPCCMILADECYVDSNHRALLDPSYAAALATCALRTADHTKQIKKNYIATLRDGLIADLVEKPVSVTDRVMGTGTYLLSPEIFRLLTAAFEPDPDRGPKDWTSWLGQLARSGRRILPFALQGGYVNINSRDDLNYANCLVRDVDFEKRTASLIYVIDDAAAPARPIEQFSALPAIAEIVAVAREGHPGSTGAAGDPKIRRVTARRDASVGELVKLGLEQATGSMLLLAYSDDTFAPRDVDKFLVYLRDADMVLGTRTTRQLIEQGTNMRGVVRAAHVVLAKLLQLVWWRFDERFTDICCVYRALWRSTYESIRASLSSPGAEVYPEMVIEVLRARRRIVEIPINYYNRDLQSDYVRSPNQTISMFARVAWLIVRKRCADAAAWAWRVRE